MIAIHTKYISPTNSRGARIKAYTANWGDRKGFQTTISYPYDKSYHLSHFEAVKELIKKHSLEWDITNMRYGDSADGKGYCFCFDHSPVEA